MATNLLFKQNNILSTGVDDDINLFTNITTGTLNFLSSLTTGILNIGNTTATTGSGGLINIGTSAKCDIIIGNATNSSVNNGNGCCTIWKLQIGRSPAIREVRFGTVAGGSSNNTVSFSPAFPTGITPFIFGTINSSNTGLIYSLVFTSVTNLSFRYNKIQTNGGGGGVGPATNESFDWYAMSS
jgi:hypothetical protein